MGKALRVVLGVHAHWTGSQWAAIDNVLEQALETALSAAKRHGAACAVDFDARGLEELAARSPVVLERLRAALLEQRVELTGACYAQPCAGLNGGESNIRQRVLGARVVQRLLGRRVRAIWEGAPSIHPQLPQIHSGLGIQAVGLVPAIEECSSDVPLDLHECFVWQGPDGTQLRALGASSLSMAFARGDFDAQVDGLPAGEAASVLMAWVPQDEQRAAEFWGRIDALRADPRLAFQATAFSALVRDLAPRAQGEPIRIGNDEVFHGYAPAKNGDLLGRGVAWCEEQLLAAEALAALLGRLRDVDREMATWPAWELDESWRELCIAQHHSIPAREGRLAAVAECSIERSLALAQEVHERTLFQLGQSVQGLEGGHLVLNPLGWARDVLHDSGVARAVPPFGYKVVDPYELDSTPLGRVRVRENDERIALVRGRMRVEIDRSRGVIEQISTREFPEGLLDPARPLLDFSLVRGGREEKFPEAEVASSSTEEEETDELTIRRIGRGGVNLTIQVAIEPLFDAVWIRIQSEDLPRPDAGAQAGLRCVLRPRLAGELKLRADSPYGVGEIRAETSRERRAPRGAGRSELVDTLLRPFTALRFADLSAADGRRGVLYVHDGAPSFARIDGGFEHLLSTVDPLDPGSFESALMADLWIVPHAGMDDAARMRRAMECTLGNPRFMQSTEIRGGGVLPAAMGALSVSPEHVLATAFWREPASAREHVEHALGTGMDAVFAVRLVEFSGRAAKVKLRVAGSLMRAARTDLLGEVLELLPVERCDAAFGPGEGPWSEISLELGANAIATIHFV